MNHHRYLALAAQVSRLRDDDRTYYLGAVGIRNDGVIVCSPNGPCPVPTPECHAEYKLCRKLTKDSRVYVVRTLADGSWAFARPCPACMQVLRSKHVYEVIYSTGCTPTDYISIRL